MVDFVEQFEFGGPNSRCLRKTWFSIRKLRPWKPLFENFLDLSCQVYLTYLLPSCSSSNYGAMHKKIILISPVDLNSISTKLSIYVLEDNFEFQREVSLFLHERFNFELWTWYESWREIFVSENKKKQLKLMFHSIFKIISVFSFVNVQF